MRGNRIRDRGRDGVRFGLRWFVPVDVSLCVVRGRLVVELVHDHHGLDRVRQHLVIVPDCSTQTEIKLDTSNQAATALIPNDIPGRSQICTGADWVGAHAPLPACKPQAAKGNRHTSRHERGDRSQAFLAHIMDRGDITLSDAKHIQLSFLFPRLACSCAPSSPAYKPQAVKEVDTLHHTGRDRSQGSMARHQASHHPTANTYSRPSSSRAWPAAGPSSACR